jgi:DNA topoisomerase VI subunit B
MRCAGTSSAVRAIVEYVTNADDIYALKGGRGRILIEVEHRRGGEPWIVRVRDRAAGMSLADLKTKIGRQGGRTSQFEVGASVRGNLGLGAKDPACFGKATRASMRGSRSTTAVSGRQAVSRSGRLQRCATASASL